MPALLGDALAVVKAGEFPLHLPVAQPAALLQFARAKCCLDGTPRLGIVRTVREPAVQKEFLNITEDRLKSVLGISQGESPHARSVHENGARSEWNELPRRGCMPSLSVTRANLPRVLGMKPHQRVDQR